MTQDEPKFIWRVRPNAYDSDVFLFDSLERAEEYVSWYSALHPSIEKLEVNAPLPAESMEKLRRGLRMFYVMLLANGDCISVSQGQPNYYLEQEIQRAAFLRGGLTYIYDLWAANKEEAVSIAQERARAQPPQPE